MANVHAMSKRCSNTIWVGPKNLAKPKLLENTIGESSHTLAAKSIYCPGSDNNLINGIHPKGMIINKIKQANPMATILDKAANFFS